MVNVFYFEVGAGDWYSVEGAIAVEARSEQDAKDIVKHLFNKPEPRSMAHSTVLTTPLGEVARIKEDKAEEILRFLYDRSQQQ